MSPIHVIMAEQKTLSGRCKVALALLILSCAVISSTVLFIRLPLLASPNSHFVVPVFRLPQLAAIRAQQRCRMTSSALYSGALQCRNDSSKDDTSGITNDENSSTARVWCLVSALLPLNIDASVSIISAPGEKGAALRFDVFPKPPAKSALQPSSVSTCAENVGREQKNLPNSVSASGVNPARTKRESCGR